MATGHIGDADHGKKNFAPPVPTGPNQSFPNSQYQMKSAIATYNKQTVPKINAMLPLAYPRAQKIK